MTRRNVSTVHQARHSTRTGRPFSLVHSQVIPNVGAGRRAGGSPKELHGAIEISAGSSESSEVMPDLQLVLPDPEGVTLSDLAARYAPPQDLAVRKGKGRQPPRYDDPRILIMLGHLEAGTYRSEACAAAGLAERTVMRWLEIGRAEAQHQESDDSPMTVYWHIWQSTLRAEAVTQVRALQTVHAAAGRGAWRAAAWFLERRYPEKWGPKAFQCQQDETPKRNQEPKIHDSPNVDINELEAKVQRILANHETQLRP